MKRALRHILPTVAGIILALYLMTIIDSCSAKPKVVNAETGEVVDEGNTLRAKSYVVPGESNDFTVAEYHRGGMIYLVFNTSQAGHMQVVNYTLDSIELSYHKEDPVRLSEEPPLMSNTKTVGIWR